MPELPEVEAARSRLEKAARGKTIVSVVTNDDPIVYSGCTHATFATAIENKTVKEVKRLGKNFYMILSSPPHPIFHFGMSGIAHVRGSPSPVYRVPRSKHVDEEWPPKYMKCCLTLRGEDGTESEWALCDPRRLGRIKLVECDEGEMEKVKPLSDLGRDPLLDMPPLETLSTALLKRHAPIKAVLLDQNGPLCGIGNYMVDEILYQSAIHPSNPSSGLSEAQLATLHTQIRLVTVTAVEADADASRFPKDWLFSARWSKGKKQKDFILPDGTSSSISFVTVGGRTSAVVDKIQILPEGIVKPKRGGSAKGKRKVKDEEEASEEEVTTPKKEARGKRKVTKVKVEVERVVEEVLDAKNAEDEMDEMGDEGVELPDGIITSPHFKRTRRTIKIDYSEADVVEESGNEG